MTAFDPPFGKILENNISFVYIFFASLFPIKDLENMNKRVLSLALSIVVVTVLLDAALGYRMSWDKNLGKE